MNFVRAEIRFDERVELTSVICRLTGMYEANNFAYNDYASDVDEYFANVKDHDAVAFVCDKQNNVQMADLIELALYLDIRNDRLVLANDVPLFDNMNRTFVTQYVEYLDQFYRDAKFHNFYSSHSGYFAEAAMCYADIWSSLDNQFLNNMYQTDVSKVEILLNSFSGAYYFPFPEKNILVFSGFASTQRGNSDITRLGSLYPCPEERIVYCLTDYYLREQLNSISLRVQHESKLYFNANGSNFVKSDYLFTEYVKILSGIYYLHTSNHDMSKWSLMVAEGGKNNVPMYVNVKKLYDSFAPIAANGLTTENLNRFADAYKAEAPKNSL